MPGRSASSDVHYCKSEDGESKFASKPIHDNDVGPIPFVGVYLPDACIRFVSLSPCLQLWTKLVG